MVVAYSDGVSFSLLEWSLGCRGAIQWYSFLRSCCLSHSRLLELYMGSRGVVYSYRLWSGMWVV